MEARVRSKVSLCGICGGQNGIVRRFSPSASVFCPVSDIPPTIRTHLHLHAVLS